MKVPVDLVGFFLSYLCVCTVCPFHRNSLFPSFNVYINFLSKNTSNNLEIVLVAVKWVEWYVRKASSFHIMQLNVKHNLKCCNCFQRVLRFSDTHQRYWFYRFAQLPLFPIRSDIHDITVKMLKVEINAPPPKKNPQHIYVSTVLLSFR